MILILDDRKCPDVNDFSTVAKKNHCTRRNESKAIMIMSTNGHRIFWANVRLLANKMKYLPNILLKKKANK